MSLSYKTKIIVDHSIGIVCVIILKFVGKFLSILLSRDHSIPSEPKAVVLAKIVGLGSIVYSGSLCKLVKIKFPSAKIIYITSKSNLELVKRFNAVDEVLCLNDKGIYSILSSVFNIIFTLWRYKPELYFDLEVYSSFSAMLATLSLARNRYGFYRKSAEFKKNLHTHMIFFNTRKHISEIYKQMALSVNASGISRLNEIITLRDKDREECHSVLKKLNIDNNRMIIVNPNASELCFERKWPQEKWVEFLSLSLKRFKEYTFLLVGAPDEEDYVSEIYEKLSTELMAEIHNVAGKFSLGGFLGLIEKCDLMITNDSGPLHIALALERPTVSMWGPTDYEHHVPMYGLQEILYCKTYCAPCMHHASFPPCQGDNKCMKSLPVMNVVEATERILFKIRVRDTVGRRNADGLHSVQVTHHDLVDFNPIILHQNISHS